MFLEEICDGVINDDAILKLEHIVTFVLKHQILNLFPNPAQVINQVE